MKNTGLFYEYFIAQHGEEKLNEISDMILAKVGDIKYPIEKFMKKEDFLKGYVMFVFEIALVDFWGMSEEETEKYVKLMLGDSIISKVGVKKVKDIHKDAIQEIQLCFNNIEIKNAEMSEDEKIINALFQRKQEEFSTAKWKKKDKEYKEKLDKYSSSMGDLYSFTEKVLTEKEKKEYMQKLEETKGAIFDTQVEEKRLYYIEGYKDGMCSVKELFDNV